MTTSILDFVNNKAISDTRWSIKFFHEGEAYLAYHDDTKFFKLASDENIVMITAGDAYLISVWKNWLKQGATMPYPPFVIADNPNRVIIPVIAVL